MTRAWDEGWLTNFWSGVFQFLKLLSLFGLFTALIAWLAKRFGVQLETKWDSPFVDAWVVLNLGAAAAAAFLATTYDSWIFACTLFTVYGAYRVLEIVVSQINVLIFDPYTEGKRYKLGKRAQPYTLRGRYRSLVLFLHNYVEIGFWFTAAYISLHREGAAFIEGYGTINPSDVIALLGTTIVSLATLNTNSHVVGEGPFIDATLISHSLISTLMTVVLLARFISLLPVPRSLADLGDTSNGPAPQPIHSQREGLDLRQLCSRIDVTTNAQANHRTRATRIDGIELLLLIRRLYEG